VTPVRVLIVADSLSREREITELLADEQGVEVIAPDGNGLFVDVLLVAGARPRNLPTDSNAVYLTDQEPTDFEGPGRAWLPLQASAGEIAAALIAAAQDLTVLTQSQARQRLSRIRATAETPEVFIEALTNRELEVLRMVADGLVNKEIAAKLGISDHTAKFHVAQILAKLGAGSRTEAVTIAIRRGLVPI